MQATPLTSYFQLLVVAITTTLSLASVPKLAPIYGLPITTSALDITSNPNTDSHQDFIIVFKNHSCNLDSLREKWHNKFGSKGTFNMTRKYMFGKFAAGHFNLSSSHLYDIRRDPEVKFLEVNRRISINQDSCNHLVDGECIQETPGKSLWGLSRTSNRKVTSFSSATFTYLSGDGQGVDAYVVDTGVYTAHEQFEGRAKMAFMSSDLSAEAAEDLNGHGTHVSGTIAGKTYGLARKVNIIGVKVLSGSGVGTLGGLLEGLQWVYNDYTTNKASGKKSKAVVNLSLGGTPGEIQSLDEAAITLISDAGLPFVVAAGNDNTDACLVSPARLATAVTVGSSSIDDTISTFSNYGPCVDILAPGENILSAYIGSPTMSAIMSGTSMSTPHVTGVVARYLSQACETDPSPSTVKAWLQNGATKLQLDLGTKLSTTNKLVYMFCLAAGKGSDDAVITPINGAGSDFLYIYIGIATLVLLCIIVLVFACFTYRKVKSVSDDVSRQSIRQYYQPPSYQTFGQDRDQQQLPNFQNPEYHKP